MTSRIYLKLFFKRYTDFHCACCVRRRIVDPSDAIVDEIDEIAAA